MCFAVKILLTVNLPNGSLAKAWVAHKDEYAPSEVDQASRRFSE